MRIGYLQLLVCRGFEIPVCLLWSVRPTAHLISLAISHSMTPSTLAWTTVRPNFF
jgi:hypothetical protein